MFKATQYKWKYLQFLQPSEAMKCSFVDVRNKILVEIPKQIPEEINLTLQLHSYVGSNESILNKGLFSIVTQKLPRYKLQT